MRNRPNNSPIFLFFTFGLILSAGCLYSNNNHQNQIPVKDVNASAIEIALNNSTVRSYLGQGYSTVTAGQSTAEINEESFSVTAVQFDTPQDMTGVNVDVQNRSIINIWTLPKRNFPPENITASFGELVNLQEIGINDSSEFYERLQKVTNNSDRDLT